ncbi:MAG: Holliday junction branch migration protein RuvA [Gemmatimonadaceae bacterium]
MISQISGTVALRELDRVELLTPGGVGYELLIPLSAYEALPRLGEPFTLHTHLVVRDDGWQLYGFTTVYERRVFQRLLAAKGVGPALALGLLSTLSAERLVRAIRERDLAALQSVPRVGRKKAEQLILDLADKLDELQGGGGGGTRPDGTGSDDAVRALVSLGYTMVEAERGVRGALEDGGQGVSAAELIRRALARIRG